MTITHVQQKDYNDLEKIATFLYAASKIVTLTGAGISTNAGIPDFRSKDGIYASGYRHLFHSSVLSNPERRPRFYELIANMRQASEKAEPTRTHRFIRGLYDSGKLVRAYTQNIDCLESKVGLSTEIQEGHKRRRQDESRAVECVLLHGSLRRLRCSNCSGTFSWNEGGREMETLSDPELPCPSCTKISDERKKKGRRASVIGKLRHDIVLYDEQDPRADAIFAIARHDQSLCLDVLLIIGTSLTTYGVKRLIRDFAKTVHKQQAGKVVFVNRTKPAKCWDGVIDYWVEWDCDAWVGDLVERQQPFRCGNRGRQAHDQVLGIGKPCLQDARLILGVPVGPTRGDGRPDGGGQGSSRDNPIDLTL